MPENKKNTNNLKTVLYCTVVKENFTENSPPTEIIYISERRVFTVTICITEKSAFPVKSPYCITDITGRTGRGECTHVTECSECTDSAKDSVQSVLTVQIVQQIVTVQCTADTGINPSSSSSSPSSVQCTADTGINPSSSPSSSSSSIYSPPYSLYSHHPSTPPPPPPSQTTSGSHSIDTPCFLNTSQ